MMNIPLHTVCLEPLTVAIKRYISLHSQITRELGEQYLTEDMTMRLTMWSWTPDKPARVPIKVAIPQGNCVVSSRKIYQDIKITLSVGWLWTLFRALLLGAKEWTIPQVEIYVPAHTHRRMPFIWESEAEVTKLAFPTWATAHVSDGRPVMIPILEELPPLYWKETE